MAVHFISDLHLDNEQKPDIGRILMDYLASKARQAEQLYLLGDIFEYWLGDDVSLPRHADICDALAELNREGVELFFMRGNRDFMVDDGFARHTGARLLEDPDTIELDGRTIMLSHGDRFCTDDVEHQKFRELVSQPEVRQRLLSLPGEQREQMAQQLRGMSKTNMAQDDDMAMDIMDVNQQTVEAQMREYDVHLLIHGHTHRPAIHDFELDGQPARRVVLADWHEDRGSVLVADGKELSFETLT